jgi:hypothetical protein
MSNPFTVAYKAKGLFTLYRRSRSIAQHYGLNASRMDHALQRFSEILRRYDCGATFPITAVALIRHSHTISKYLDKNIEFAVHGYTHIDYKQIAPESQLDHLQRARDVFTRVGIAPLGFRSPYLRRDDHLYAAIDAAGFSYVSNQPILWDTVDKAALASSVIAGYERAITFYDPWRAAERVSLPRQKGNLIEIPIALPDDEILIERLGGINGLVKETWRSILTLTYQRGELFTLQLHPERTALCANGLSTVLAEARALKPAVWCARLDEIAAWWKVRAEASVAISETDNGECHCIISGPSEITILARAIEINAPSSPWTDGYRIVNATSFAFKSPCRPFIGLSPSTSDALTSFLHQQGYLVEFSLERNRFAYYIDQNNFDPSQEQVLLEKIEGSGQPLLKLGRWPNGAKSALSITGDIDAITLWDYGLRLIGK